MEEIGMEQFKVVSLWMCGLRAGIVDAWPSCRIVDAWPSCLICVVGH
jgi:hypothetical protein